MAPVASRGEAKTKTKQRKVKMKPKCKSDQIPETEEVSAIAVKCSKPAINSRPVMTKDSRNLICVCGPEISIFRRKTGILEHSFDHHKTNVHSLFAHPKDPFLMVSCCSNLLVIWDYKDLTIRKKYNVGRLQPTACLLSSTKPGYGYFRIPMIDKEKKISKKEVLVFDKLQATGKDESLKIGVVSRKRNSFAINPLEQYIASIYKEKLSIYSIETKTTHTLVNDETQLTCLEFHPKKSIVATGDKQGKIVLWHKYHKEDDAVAMQIHWHNDMVTDLLFSHAPVPYLMSGGKEGVLVIWQTETKEKSFVPRLGGAINTLFQSDDGQYIGTTLDSNVVKVLSSANNSLVSSIRLLSPAHEHIGLRYHHPTECIVLNGRVDGELQFYNPIHQSLKTKIDVVGENLVSSVPERYVYPTRLEAYDITSDGIWMATVEVREDRILPTERKLKLWKYSDEQRNYVLNTFVEPPHDDVVTALFFRPPSKASKYENLLISASKDGYLKTWVLTEEKNNKNEIDEIWQHHSLSVYGAKESCKHASFSSDGSVLALLFAEITLWDPETLTFQTSLSWNQAGSSIKSIYFCCEESSNYLVSHSDNFIIVWDINTCSIHWQLQANTSLLVVDQYSKYFAAFAWFGRESKNHVYLFDPASANPAEIVNGATQKYQKPIVNALFTPPPHNEENVGKTKWSETGCLYYVTEDTELMTIKDPTTSNTASSQLNPEQEQESAFESIFGITPKERSTVDDGANPNVPVGNPASVVIRKMISTPAHVLPSVDVMCQTFIKSLLIQKKNDEQASSSTVEVINTSDSEESDMEVDDDSPVSNLKQVKEGEDSSNMSEDNNKENKYELPDFNLPTYNFDFLADVF